MKKQYLERFVIGITDIRLIFSILIHIEKRIIGQTIRQSAALIKVRAGADHLSVGDDNFVTIRFRKGSGNCTAKQEENQ